MRSWVVRCGVFEQERTPALMTLVQYLTERRLAVLHRNDGDGACFDLLPRTTRQEAIARAEAMAGEGINAVAAPEWKEGQ